LAPIEAAAARLPQPKPAATFGGGQPGERRRVGLYPFIQSEETKGPILSDDIDQFGPLTKKIEIIVLPIFFFTC
jgi:hypothetical protein